MGMSTPTIPFSLSLIAEVCPGVAETTTSSLSYERERERERNVLFNDALTTFYLRLYGVRHMVKEGRKEMFYLTTHSTYFIYGYVASDIIMVKDHSDSEKGNPLPPHRLLLSINSKGSFICTIPQTG